MIKKTFTIKTKYGIFKCIFEPEKDMKGYTVESRDVPGAVTWGKNIIEAKKMMIEAIEGAIEAQAIASAEKKGIIQIKNHSHTLLNL
ncbi:MAG: hypothetical protein AAB799_01500 [Patescibacteria group bacterium]